MQPLYLSTGKIQYIMLLFFWGDFDMLEQQKMYLSKKINNCVTVSCIRTVITKLKQCLVCLLPLIISSI